MLVSFLFILLSSEEISGVVDGVADGVTVDFATNGTIGTEVTVEHNFSFKAVKVLTTSEQRACLNKMLVHTFEIILKQYLAKCSCLRGIAKKGFACQKQFFHKSLSLIAQDLL